MLVPSQVLRWAQDWGKAKELAWQVAAAYASGFNAITEPQPGIREWLHALSKSNVPLCHRHCLRQVQPGHSGPRCVLELEGFCSGMKSCTRALPAFRVASQGVHRKQWQVAWVASRCERLVSAFRLRRNSVRPALERLGLLEFFIATVTAEDGMEDKEPALSVSSHQDGAPSQPLRRLRLLPCGRHRSAQLHHEGGGRAGPPPADGRSVGGVLVRAGCVQHPAALCQSPERVHDTSTSCRRPEAQAAAHQKCHHGLIGSKVSDTMTLRLIRYDIWRLLRSYLIK